MDRFVLPAKKAVVSAVTVANLIQNAIRKGEQEIFGASMDPGVIGYRADRTGNLAQDYAGGTVENPSLAVSNYARVQNSKGVEYRLYKDGRVTGSLKPLDDEELAAYLLNNRWPFATSAPITVVETTSEAATSNAESITRFVVAGSPFVMTWVLDGYIALRSDATLRLVLPVKADASMSFTATIKSGATSKGSVSGTFNASGVWELFTCEIPLSARHRNAAGDLSLDLSVTGPASLEHLSPDVHEARGDFQTAAFVFPDGSMRLFVDKGRGLTPSTNEVSAETTTILTSEITASAVCLWIERLVTRSRKRAVVTGQSAAQSKKIEDLYRSRILHGPTFPERDHLPLALLTF